MKHVGKWFVGVVVMSGGTLLAVACGSTASTPSDGSDASGQSDVTNDVTVFSETSSMQDVTADSATCDLSVDLTTEIPDAALNEAGTHSTGLCLACINQTSTCKSYIDQCNGDCDCKNLITSALPCIAMGGNEIACALAAGGASLPPNAMMIGEGLLGCIQGGPCASQCTPQGATDGGTDADDDGSDGS